MPTVRARPAGALDAARLAGRVGQLVGVEQEERLGLGQPGHGHEDDLAVLERPLAHRPLRRVRVGLEERAARHSSVPRSSSAARLGADEVGDAVARLREAGNARPVEAVPRLVPQRGLRREHVPVAARVLVMSPGHSLSSMDFELSEELAALQETVPPDRPGQGQAPGPRDRRDRASTRRTSSRSSATPACSACASRRSYGGGGRRHPRAHHRHRGGGEVLEHGGADAAADPAADRVRCMIAGSPRSRSSSTSPGSPTGSQRAAFGLSEPQAGSDVMGMRTKAVARRRRLGPQRHEVLDVRRRAGRLVHGVRQDVRPTSPPRNHDSITAFIVERGWDGVEVGATRPQDGRARRRHRRAAARRRAGAGRERDRRGRRLPPGHARAQLDAPDRRGPRHRAGRGRADVRHRVREGARGVHARRSPTSRASSGRSPSWPPRSRRPGC